MIGHPNGMSNQIISNGITSSSLINFPINNYEKNKHFKGFTITAPISPGSSGSPIFSKDGKIIGIIVATTEDSQNLNIAISSSEIINLLQSYSKDIYSADFHYFIGQYDEKKNDKEKTKKDFSNNIKKEVNIYPDIIREILIKNIPSFKQCYQKTIDKEKLKYYGIITLDYTINSLGRVTKADAKSISGVLPNDIKTCVSSALKEILFPKPENGGIVEISNQQFNFYIREKQ